MSNDKMYVLLEAHSLINGERAEIYGGALESFKRLAGMYSYYIGDEITAADAVAFMVLLKLVRLRASDWRHRDSLVDAAGYIGLLEQVCVNLE